MGEPGEKGEPGKDGINGRIVDVFVNSESVVDSEGKAYINIEQGLKPGRAVEFVDSEGKQAINVMIDNESIKNYEGPDAPNGLYVDLDSCLFTEEPITQVSGYMGKIVQLGLSYDSETLKVEGGKLKAIPYVAGDNVEIDGHVISAKDTLYFAGENISIDSENVISAKDTLYSAGENISIDSDNVISAIDTKYSAGENVSIDSENVISAKDTLYYAGNNVTIDADNVINAIDTVYTAGENVTISDDNVISAVDHVYTAGKNITISSDGVISANDENTKYTAGENISISSEGVISAVDTKYTAGQNVEITADNVINVNVSDALKQAILVTQDLGGYTAGTTIDVNTPLEDILRTLLSPYVPPTPPITNRWYSGVFNEPPTSLSGSWNYEQIEDIDALEETGKIQYFTTKKQYIGIAYPASMGNLIHIYESGLIETVDAWTRREVIRDGVPYLMYVFIKNQVSNAPYTFKWRI